MVVHAQIQAQWTPNANDQNDGGPLPLSMQQRQQLLQLEQQIASSPDPSATLEHVAQQNGLSASDLSRMLQRNQADLAATGSGGAGAASMVGAQRRPGNSSRRPHVLWTALTTITSLVGRIVAQHPRSATLLVTLLLGVWYVACVAIPSTGCTWSTGPRQAWRTKGATTLWSPPLAHVQDLVQHMPTTSTLESLHDDDDDEDDELWSSFSPDRLYDVLQVNDPSTTIPDGVTWHNTRTNKGKRRFQKAVTVQLTRVLNPDEVSLSATDDATRELYQQQQSELYLLYATQMLHNLDLTEFASLVSDQDTKDTSHRGRSTRDKLILVAADRRRRRPFGDDDAWQDNEDEPRISSSNPSPRRAILVVPGLGDWGRYGLLPLLVWPLYDGDEQSVSLRLTVAPGGHWDGDIVVSVTVLPTPSNESETNDESMDDSLSVQVRVTLLSPTGRDCVAPTRAMATTLTRALARSVAMSLHQRVGLVQTRSRQSLTLQSATRQFALTKRGHRSRLERQMEEMAVERRRKWQRRNPSGTSNYRPSGERMRSPNHASYH
jgi:hypothetical protein